MDVKELKELFHGVASTKTIDGALAAASRLREELEQHIQREREKTQRAEYAIEALAECLLLHQDVEETERPLIEKEPFKRMIEEVIDAFEEFNL